MTEIIEQPVEGGARSASLRAGSIGLPGVLFLIIATVAPMSGTVGALPLAFGLGSGAGTPAAFVVVAVILIFFAVGYIAMSRHIATAGGFYVYIGEGLGLRAARAAGYLAFAAYNIFQIAIWGTFGFFFNQVTAEWFGWDVSWLLWVLGGIAIVGVLGYFEIDFSARVLAVAVALETLVLLVMDVAILASGGAHGVTLQPLSPSALKEGNLGIGLMLCLQLFIGFEATAIYSEEARDPHRTIPRAAMSAVLIIGAFYVLTSLSLTLGYGVDTVAQHALDNPGQFVFGMGQRYVGSAEVTAMKILFLVSTFATNQGFHNAIARYQFSLARDGWAPRAVGRTHPDRGSPFIASFVQTGIAVIVVVGFYLAGADPYTQMFTWLIGLGGLGLMTLMAAASIAAVVFFRRHRELENGAWSTLIAPVLGAVGLTTLVVLLLVHWDVEVGTSSGALSYLPLALLIPLCIGLLWPKGRRPANWRIR